MTDKPHPAAPPAAAALIAALGCVIAASPAAADDLVERGHRLFAGACAACHGSQGRGDGPGARDLDPRPRDLTSRHFRFRTTANGELPRAEDLERTLRQGLPGSSMPAFGDLFSDDEYAALAGFVLSLQPEGAPASPAPLDLAPVPQASEAQVRDGRAIYLLSGCWRCHGIDGDGRGPSARSLTDDAGNRIQATDFRFDPFKGGRRPEDVVRALRTGLNGTPMPSYDDAMMIARSDPGDTASLEGRLDTQDEASIRVFLDGSPTRAELDAMTPESRAGLRDVRMAALAHYVLSLERRRGAGYWLWRRHPEREARR